MKFLILTSGVFPDTHSGIGKYVFYKAEQLRKFGHEVIIITRRFHPDHKLHEEIIDGKKFIVAEIKRMALFPTDAGTKKISPMQIECDVRVQTRRRSIFDSFFDDNFTVNKERAIEICKGIIERNLHIQWAAESHVSHVSKDLLTWMRKSGC